MLLPANTTVHRALLASVARIVTGTDGCIQGSGLGILCGIFLWLSPQALSAQEDGDRVLPLAGTSAAQILERSGFAGGLIVLAGIETPDMILEASESSRALVQGLVADAGRRDSLRESIRRADRYGRVSVRLWNARSLPYADGIVNLMVVLPGARALSAAEVDRVLAPGGTVWRETGGSVVASRKAWPEDTDEWSHSRYDATGNAVSRDRRVGPPRHLKWEAWPRWNHGTKTSCMVSAQGRIFFILDDSHFSSSVRTWSLIARDAANGLLLWRHELAGWEGARGGKKVGPAQVHRRLVAIGDRVYATLGEAAPVSALDAASGTVIRTFEQTKPAQEFIVSDGILVAMVDPNTPAAIRRGKKQPLSVVAMNADSGEVLWQHREGTILALTMAADGRQLVYHDGSVIKSFELRSGAPRWSSGPTGQKVVHKGSSHPDKPGAEAGTIVLAPQFAPTLIIYNDVVAFAGGRQLNVVSAADGTELWRTEYAPSNYSVPVDLFGFDGALWGPDPTMNFWRPLDDNIDFNAYNPLTGEPKARVEGDYGFRFQHHRCHQMKVVDSTVLAARAGIEFLDTDSGEVASHHWTRGSCFYGVMPANGLLYVPPHNCACYVRAKLSGLMALSGTAPRRSGAVSESERLQPGPAYGDVSEDAALAAADDWPTYRHGAARSGRSAAAVPADLLLGWEQQIGGGLTPPVIANGRVFLAASESHAVIAVDADSGEVLWQVTLDARIDSPPTVYQGLVLVGCRDGSVQALRAADGQRVWRFMAAPEERLIVSHGQVESVWPVPGSVLVVNDTVYVSAGRSSYLDGGIHLYGLDPHTGAVRVRQVLWSRDEHGAQTMDEQSVDGYLNDVLSSDGQRLFMRHQVLDLAGNPISERVTHLHSPDGFLGGDTTTRLLWTYAPLYTSPHQGAFYDLRLSRMLFPSGRILVEDQERMFGYGQNHYERMRPDPGGAWALFSSAKAGDVSIQLTAKEYRNLALAGQGAVPLNWWQRVPISVRALVLAGDTLFAAGPRGRGTTSPDALAGKTAATLLAVDPDTGETKAEMTLPSTPVWDGMAAAGNSLYLSLANGKVLRLWGVDSGRPGTPLSAAGWSASLPPVEIAEEPGLAGRWRFDEGAGMLARDCSGRGHDAEVTGRWAEGEFGTCVVAQGSSQAVVIPDAPHLHFGNDDFSLAFWVKIDGYDVRLVGKEAFPENWWVINVLSSGQAELVLGEGRGPGQSVRPKTESVIPTDAWCHLVVVADRQAGEVRWHVNGKLDSRAAIPATMTEGLHADGIDIAIPSAHKPFRGLIGDLRIYTAALPADRIEDLFQEQAERRRSTKFTIRD